MPQAKPTRHRAPAPNPTTADLLRWADDPRPITPPRLPWWKTPTAAMGAAAAAICVTAAFTLPAGAAAARTAPPGCDVHVVARGDTLTSIARRHGFDTVAALVAMNPHIADPNRIWPGDEIAVACIDVARVETRAGTVDVDAWRGQWESPGVASWEWIVAELWAAGFRGDDLVTMAAITPGESGRRPDAVGDQNIAGELWGPSVGLWQIRTLWAQQGTGGPRDIDALTGDVAHQAAAARAVWDSQGFAAWTCWRINNHVGSIPAARAAAERIGAL